MKENMLTKLGDVKRDRDILYEKIVKSNDEQSRIDFSVFQE